MSARCFSEPIPASPKITPLGRRLSESQSTSVWGYHPFDPFKPCDLPPVFGPVASRVVTGF